MQIRQAGNAAKQAEMNADAQAKAIGQEKKRQALEQSENQRRAAVEHGVSGDSASARRTMSR